MSMNGVNMKFSECANAPTSKFHLENALKKISIIKLKKVNLLRFILLRLYSLKHLSVENIGVEPMTSCVQGRRSSQLS